MKIKLKFIKINKDVLMYIDYQTPEFHRTRTSGYGLEFTSSSGFRIRSVNTPEMADNILYLKGTDNYKNGAIRSFRSEEEAIKYIHDAEQALREWSADPVSGDIQEQDSNYPVQFETTDITI